MLGEMAKVELDSARHTHQLFSKILIGESMPHTLIYWAPEVLKLEKYTTFADIWSLGVTMYQIATGEHPFTVSNEDEFRDDVLTANYDASRLQAYPRLEIIIENFLKVDPEERWDANMALAFAQEEFVVEIQRIWRGHMARLEFMRRCRALILIQAHVKGFVYKRRYQRKRRSNYMNAILKLQSIFRGLKDRRKFRIAKRALMKCQANVLTRQFRTAFLNTKSHVTSAQMFIKRYLAMKWFKNLQNKKKQLDENLDQINFLINRHNMEAHDFKNQIKGYAGTYEGYEVTEVKKRDKEDPVLENVTKELQRLLEENRCLQNELRKRDFGEVDEETKALQMQQLEKELGPKAREYEGMVRAVKDTIKRVSHDVKMAKKLPIKMQHVYHYSKWDSINEPQNVVENVLKDNDSFYKALTPDLDFTLNGGIK